ncbi:MAG TPA: redox-sensing transcriptional repressor Rex [Armatimonadota bacterium]|nr:redox-sensing transcriptional repressor Rex [Armatimonadota bacterium]
MAMQISGASLRRLPQYVSVLVRLAEEGQRHVTSAELARRLRLDETLVRKDLAMTKFAGKPRVGFGVPELLAHLRDFLGAQHAKEAILVGAGRLGQALVAYHGFEKYNLSIVALFDTNPEKIGGQVEGRQIYPLWQAAAFARRHGIRIAILTVPSDAAQPVADLLADAGVLAFWNFSGHPLNLPDPVVVLNEDLAESLAVLSHRVGKLTLVGAEE